MREVRLITDIASTALRREWWYACRLFGMNSLKGGAMSHVYPLLGNGLLNTFWQKQTCGTVVCLFLGNGPVNTYS
jgi:hypothetical protein